MDERPEPSGWAAEPISIGPPARFRGSLTRAKWAMVLVGIATAALLLLVVEAAKGFNLLDHVATTTVDEVEQWQRGVNAAVGLNLITEFVAAIAFLAWLSRVVDNVPALGGGQPNTTPRWAIGWWFVPIASWFKPYQVVADVWRRLATGPREVGTGVLLAWWVLWIGGGLTGNLVPRLAAPTTVDGVRTLLLVVIAAAVAQVMAGILLVRITWEIERRAEARETGPGTAPAAVPVER